MKINQPVTGHKIRMQEGDFLVSTTDLIGIITSGNRAFIEMSGYLKSELVGKTTVLYGPAKKLSEGVNDLVTICDEAIDDPRILRWTPRKL